MLVTKISVVAWASAIAAAPTMVFPAPQGSTTTPEPPCQKESAACRWYGRSSQPVWSRLDRVRLAVDVAGQVLGRPAELEQHLLQVAALGRVHHDGVLVDRAPTTALDLGAAQHLVSTGAVGADQDQAVRGCFSIRSRP